MISAQKPINEKERLKRVMELGLLDTEPEERFDIITREALRVFNVPISTITLIGKEREWYKSCQGLDSKEAPREISFCAHAMLGRDIFVIRDASKDKRFWDNPMVTGKPFIRFYAGVSLWSEDGINIGVFCIKDTKPRDFSSDDMSRLLSFADRAEAEIRKYKKTNI